MYVSRGSMPQHASVDAAVTKIAVLYAVSGIDRDIICMKHDRLPEPVHGSNFNGE